MVQRSGGGVDERLGRTLSVLRGRGDVDGSALLRTVRRSLVRTYGGRFKGTSGMRMAVGPRAYSFSICTSEDVMRCMRSPTVRVSLTSTLGVASETRVKNVVRIPVRSGRFKHVTARGTGGIVLRGVHRRRHGILCSRCCKGRGRMMANVIRHIVNGGMDVGLNGTSTMLDRGRRIGKRAFRPAREVGICVLRIGSAPGKPHVLMSEARPKLIGHLFRSRITRMGSKAIRVGDVTHRTNSHAGVTM